MRLFKHFMQSIQQIFSLNMERIIINRNNKQAARKSIMVAKTRPNRNNTPRILRPITPTVRCSHRFRFINLVDVVKLDVRDTDLLFLLGVAISATAVSPIFGSVKLKKVEMLNTNNTNSVIDYIEVEWKGNNPAFGNDSVIAGANSLSNFQYAHLSTKPPLGSYADSWVAASGYNLFQVTAMKGSVIDVTLEFTLIEDTPSFMDPSINVGLSIGDMYCHTLTSQHAPGIWIPQGWNVSA